jgi:hypothetical protein
VEKNVCWAVSAGAEASFGVKYKENVDSPLEIAVGVEQMNSRESCSSWTEVPGGYTVFLSVFDQKDPNFAQAYALVPEFDYKLPTNKSVKNYGHGSQAKVVCINRLTTMGLDPLEAGAYVENNIKLSSKGSR